jgi:hypothetical protein
VQESMELLCFYYPKIVQKVWNCFVFIDQTTLGNSAGSMDLLRFY